MGSAESSPDRSTALAGRRGAVMAGLVYLWVRVGLIMSAVPFETPDTESYRSGQGTRPPVSAAALSLLGDRPYVFLSAVVSSLGFLAIASAVWRPARRSWSIGAVTAVGVVSFLPMVAIYEHWLVPDGLIVGLSLIAVALAARPVPSGWYPPTLVGLCAVITITKEVGAGVVVLVAAVLVVRSSWRLGGAAVLVSLLLFATIVLPGSSRQGTVLWGQPEDSPLTMERFRIVSAGLLWSDLSPELDEVGRRAEVCGMSREQLFAETFRLTDRPRAFVGCDDLWEVVDDLSQLDVLLAHVSNPSRVTSSIERGFAADLGAMARWGAAPYGQEALTGVDRWIAGLVSAAPLAVLAISLVRRHGRRLAFVGVLGSGMALCAALVDAGSQDRHTLVFRLVAAAIALIALADATAPRPAPAGEEPAEVVGRVDALDGA